MTDNWNERDLINLLANKVRADSNVLGHHEDAIAVRQGEQYLVLNIDGWVESTDRPPYMTLFHAGVRAVANSLSDIYAKGARPTGFSVSYTLPRFLEFSRKLDEEGEMIDSVEDLTDGVIFAADKFGVPYLGGDINEGKELVIDVVAWGLTDQPIARNTASPGEKICWIGPPLGSTSAALGILLDKWHGDIERSIEIMGNPDLYPGFLQINASAAIDCSDGLSRSLHLLAEASGVGIDLDGKVRIDPWVNSVALENELPLTDLILFGGEELGIVFSCADNLDLPDEVIILGTVTDKTGVYLGEDLVQNKGWDHFSVGSPNQ